MRGKRGGGRKGSGGKGESEVKNWPAWGWPAWKVGSLSLDWIELDNGEKVMSELRILLWMLSKHKQRFLVFILIYLYFILHSSLGTVKRNLRTNFPFYLFCVAVYCLFKGKHKAKTSTYTQYIHWKKIHCLLQGAVYISPCARQWVSPTLKLSALDPLWLIWITSIIILYSCAPLFLL